MNDILLENYIREVLYSQQKDTLDEISLKDFSPKTNLESGLQIGIISLLAWFGNDLSKKKELPPEPKAQAEAIIDTVEQESLRNPKIKDVLDRSNLQKVEDDLARALEEKPVEDIYKQISPRKMKKLRDWLSDKEGGHEVSIDGHILSRADFDYFNKLNDDRLNHNREPLTVDKFVELRDLNKKVEEQEKRREAIFDEALTFNDDGMPSFDHTKLGIDDDGNFNKERFVEDATGITLKLFELEDSGAFKSGSNEKFMLYKTRQAIDKASSFISCLDENGEWKDGDIMSKEEVARFYKSADQEVKNIVSQHYPNLENLDLEEM